MAKKRRKRRSRRKGGSPLRRFVPLVLLGALLVGGFIAWVATRPETGEEQRAACALVIDRTTSSDDSLTVERYKALATKTIDGCREKQASLSIYYFDQVNQKLVLANDQEFALWLPRGRKESAQENDLDTTLAAANDTVNAVFAQPAGAARGSDVLSALDGAAQNLQHQAAADGVEQLYLVILTDGIQLSTDVSVETFTDETVDPQLLVVRASDLGLVTSDLDGVQVTFVGVRGGQTNGGEQLPEWFEAKVETFWRQVVSEGGGRVCTYVVDSPALPVGC